MANRWKGSLIAAAAASASGTNYTGKANGKWSIHDQMQAKQVNSWAKGLTIPSGATFTSLVAADSAVTVNFSIADDGGQTVSSYTVTSSPGNITASGVNSPITVSGLTNGTAYTFTVTATNVSGSSTSNPSTSVTPAGSFIIASTSRCEYYIMPLVPNGIGDLTAAGDGAAIDKYSASTLKADNSVLVVHTTNFAVKAFKMSAAGTISSTYNSLNASGWYNGFSCKPVFLNNTTVAFVDALGEQGYIRVYAWDDTNGFGTKYANLTLSKGTDFGCNSFSYDSDSSKFVATFNTYPPNSSYSYFTIIPFTAGSGFGTITNGPTFANSGRGAYGSAFTKVSPNNGLKALYISYWDGFGKGYYWNNGAIYSEISLPTTNFGWAGYYQWVNFSTDGNYATTKGEIFNMINGGTDIGTKLTSPTYSFNPSCSIFNANNNGIIVGANAISQASGQPLLVHYPFTSSGFGSQGSSYRVAQISYETITALTSSKLL
jgi:hypothetical protein